MLSDRQKQIIDQSINVIHIHGIQGFTIKNISRAVGLSEAAIYRHFKSKTEILCAVLDNFLNILADFVKINSEQKINSLEKIKRILKKLSTTFTQKPAYISVIFAEEIFKNEKLLSEKVNQLLKNNNRLFNSIIKTGQEANEITKSVKSQELTLMIMGAFRLLVKNWNMSDFTFNLEERSDKLYSSIVILIREK